MATLPLQLLCSSKFGRFSKISLEQCWNMFQIDGWMVPYAGYISVNAQIITGVGRGIFYSARSNTGYMVLGENVYSITFPSAIPWQPIVTYVASLSTSYGDVFIDENLMDQIAFCDKQYIYIYDYSTSAFARLPLDFSAGYVTFQDTYFIASCNGLPEWRISDDLLLAINTATVVNGGSGYHVGDVLTLVGGKNGTITVATLSGSAVDTVTVPPGTSNISSGFDDSVTYAVTGGHGTAATFSITLQSGFTPSSEQTGSFETKPDNVMACVRVPGKPGQLLVMGKTVTELWSDLKLQLFQYQRNSGYIIDFGCLNAATIATNEEFVIWLGSNEKSGPAILLCAGGPATQISDDGINYRLAQLVNPENSFGFIFKQDGQTFYQLTFADPADNVTFVYHFNAKKFYNLCDPYQNYHIARRVAYFNNNYYFISATEPILYQLSNDFNTANGQEIPRIIITPTSALTSRAPFVVNSITFPIEQGENEIDARVDLSTSSDGGITFGNPFGLWLNNSGKRRNIFKFYNLGRYNEVIFQFRFYGLGRFVLSDGEADIV